MADGGNAGDAVALAHAPSSAHPLPSGGAQGTRSLWMIALADSSPQAYIAHNSGVGVQT